MEPFGSGRTVGPVGDRPRDQRREQVVPALVPTRRSPRTQRAGLPIAPLVNLARKTSMCYALTTLDNCGRLADRSLVRGLRWEPGHRIEITAVPQAAMIIVSGIGGSDAINGQGHLQLPVAVRRSCNLETGDRVLLAADRERGAVLAYTMAALDAMILAWRPATGPERPQ